MNWEDHPNGAQGKHYRLISLGFLASYSAWAVGIVGVIAGLFIGAYWDFPVIGALVGGVVAWALMQIFLSRMIRKDEARTAAAKNDDYSRRWSAGSSRYK